LISSTEEVHEDFLRPPATVLDISRLEAFVPVRDCSGMPPANRRDNRIKIKSKIRIKRQNEVESGHVSGNSWRKWLIGNGRVLRIFHFCPVLVN
jgi:hypothetical protein